MPHIQRLYGRSKRNNEEKKMTENELDAICIDRKCRDGNPENELSILCLKKYTPHLCDWNNFLLKPQLNFGENHFWPGRLDVNQIHGYVWIASWWSPKCLKYIWRASDYQFINLLKKKNKFLSVSPSHSHTHTQSHAY